jgi:hypothetical protein
MIKKIVSRKDARTLCSTKLRNNLFLHPHPTSPIKGEEFVFPPLAGGIEGGE